MQLVYLFPITAVTNNHEFSGLKQHKFVILYFCRPEIWNGPHRVKIKVSAGMGCVHCWRPWERICFLAFSSFYRLPLFLGLWNPSIFKTCSGYSSLPAIILVLTLLPSSSPFKDHCDYIGHTWIMEDTLLAQDQAMNKVQIPTGCLQRERSGAILFLNLGSDYTGEFTLWKLRKLFTYDLCIFLCIRYTLIKSLLENISLCRIFEIKHRHLSASICCPQLPLYLQLMPSVPIAYALTSLAFIWCQEYQDFPGLRLSFSSAWGDFVCSSWTWDF